LRLKTEMTHNRHSALHQPLYDILMSVETLELDRVGAGGHEHLGSIQSGRHSLPVGQKGHIGDDKLPARAAHDRLGVEAHDVKAGLERRGMPVHDHRHAIPDEDRVNGAFRDQSREGVIVTSYHRELSALGL
jgi:hypothetical protein